MIRLLMGPFRASVEPLIKPIVKSGCEKLQKCVNKAMPPKVPEQPPKLKVVLRAPEEMEEICWRNFDRQMKELAGKNGIKKE
jgi:hypothetical protein